MVILDLLIIIQNFGVIETLIHNFSYHHCHVIFYQI